MKKMKYDSFGCEVSVATNCAIIPQGCCDYEADTIFYAVERFFTHCNSIAEECTKISWQFRVAKGRAPKKQPFMYFLPAALMELPANWVKISGNIDATGVNVTKIEMFQEHPVKIDKD